MEIIIIIASVLVILGIVGSVIPAMPGPVLSYAGLLVLYFSSPGKVSLNSVLVFGALMIFLTIIDYAAPVLGAKFSGASKNGLGGSILGAFLGILFFPPLGIFLGAFFGAFLGELLGGKEPSSAIRAGLGTILGSFSVIILQTAYSIVLAGYFFWKLI